MSGRKKVVGHKRKRTSVKDAAVPTPSLPPPPQDVPRTLAERTLRALRVYSLIQKHRKGSTVLFDFITTQHVDWAAVVGKNTLLYHMWNESNTSLDETLAAAFTNSVDLSEALTKVSNDSTSALRLGFTGQNQTWSATVIDASSSVVAEVARRDNSFLLSVLRATVDSKSDPTGEWMASIDRRACKLLRFTPDELITRKILLYAVAYRRVEFLTALVPRLPAIDVASFSLLSLSHRGGEYPYKGREAVATAAHTKAVLATLRACNKEHYDKLPFAIDATLADVDFLLCLSKLVASYLQPLVYHDD